VPAAAVRLSALTTPPACLPSASTALRRPRAWWRRWSDPILPAIARNISSPEWALLAEQTRITFAERRRSRTLGVDDVWWAGVAIRLGKMLGVTNLSLRAAGSCVKRTEAVCTEMPVMPVRCSLVNSGLSARSYRPRKRNWRSYGSSAAGGRWGGCWPGGFGTMRGAARRPRCRRSVRAPVLEVCRPDRAPETATTPGARGDQCRRARLATDFGCLPPRGSMSWDGMANGSA
jgi:hypothetical protein